MREIAHRQFNVKQAFVVALFITWLAPQAGKMSQIPHRDWLPERAKWSYFARSGQPAMSSAKAT